ncbi:MAG: sensor histidine kinase [Cellulosilyticaceae bacterium]
MIEELRKKFILVSVISVFVVLATITITLNVVNYIQIQVRADELLTVISDNDGKLPKPIYEAEFIQGPYKKEKDPFFSARYFSVKENNQGDILAVGIDRVPNLTNEEAIMYGDWVVEKGDSKGMVANFRYRVVTNNQGRLVIFLDCSRDIEMFRAFMINTIFISLIGIAAVFILVLVFSRTAIKPIIEAYEKQKRFITDASHELKTPLTIISTNTDVLEMDYGESEWSKSIKNQIVKLSLLVSNLVTLLRMDEETESIKAVDFSLSDAVIETVTPFALLFEADNKSLKMNVEKNISYYGNEEMIRELISIILDNASKYSAPNTEVEVVLKKQGRKYVFIIENQANGLQKGVLDYYFERFYRNDESRNSQSGGHGIGLSIAKAIVKKHKGKITAFSPDGKKFVLTIYF